MKQSVKEMYEKLQKTHSATLLMDSSDSPEIKKRVSLVLEDIPESSTKFERPEKKRRNTFAVGKTGALGSFLNRMK
jgi:hypothetical protein